MNKTKIYGFNNGGYEGFLQALAITEYGEVIAQHCCSLEYYMPHDLGMDGKSDWKHDIYAEACPDGFELEFVPFDRIEEHKGLQKAFKLYKDFESYKNTVANLERIWALKSI